MTANPHRGEVNIEADGETYTLRYTSNSMARLEERFDLSITEIGDRLDGKNVRMGDLITVFWGGLWHNHRDLTEEDAGDILDAIGAVNAVNAIGEAFKRAFPAQEAGNSKSRPRKARSQARSTS